MPGHPQDKWDDEVKHSSMIIKFYFMHKSVNVMWGEGPKVQMSREECEGDVE